MENEFDVSLKIDELFNQDNSEINVLVKKEDFTSTNFMDIENFRNNLFKGNLSSISEPISIESKTEESFSYGKYKHQNIFISNWKNFENISARLLDSYDNIVLLECLIDRDEWIYEEREFDLDLFEEYDLTVGNLFYIRFFKRPNEMKMQIHNDPKLTFSTDFPKTNLKSKFKQSKLFK